MATKQLQVNDYLSSEGIFVKQWPGFQFRSDQLDIAETVVSAIADNQSIAMEAPTGLGKTLAYLLPALLSDKKIIISVGNRTLQDHLWLGEFHKLKMVLDDVRDLKILKGCENYVCRSRLVEQFEIGNSTIAEHWNVLLQWLAVTESGEVESVPLNQQTKHVLSETATVTSAQCLGQQCTEFHRCYFQRARVQALEAKLLLINHSLLLSDNRLFEKGMLALLPAADVVIVDEAHQLPDMLCRSNTEMIDGHQFNGWLNRMKRVFAHGAASYTYGRELLKRLHAVWSSIRSQLADQEHHSGVIIVAPASFKPLLSLFQEFAVQLQHIHLAVQDINADLQKLREWQRLLEQAITSQRAIHCDLNSENIRLISPTLSKPFARLQQQGVTWVFLSATLVVDGDIRYFKRALSLPELEFKTYQAAMDYERNALLWLPQDLPEPDDELFYRAWTVLLLKVWERLDGGLLALFSSHQALQQVAKELPETLPRTVLVFHPGDDRQEILQRFRQERDALLLATGSFWEGVDIPGAALSCVAIDKLPFAAPNDLLAQVWKSMAAENQDHWFNDYMLPQAVTRLRQGIGRLLRNPQDKGLVILGDVRVKKRPYGHRVLSSLPKMPVISEFHQLEEILVQKGISRYPMSPELE